MKKNILSHLLFVIANLFVCSSLRAEPIRVELKSQTSLAPIYLCKIQDDSASFAPAYLKQLLGVLHFDFDNSGYSKVAPSDEILEKALLHRERSVAFNPQRWAKAGYAYALGVHLSQALPPWLPAGQRKDNWQTTAWAQTSGSVAREQASLVHDDHL